MADRKVAEVTKDGNGNVTIRPPPAVLSLSALHGQGFKGSLRTLVDMLRRSGVKVNLTAEQQAEYSALAARGE